MLKSRGDPFETLVRDFIFCAIRNGADAVPFSSLHTAAGATAAGPRRGARKRAGEAPRRSSRPGAPNHRGYR